MRCPVGIGRKPTRGSLRGKAKDRALDGLFWAKVEKDRKRLEKIPKRSAHLIETCCRSRFLTILGWFWEGFGRAKWNTNQYFC